jgi:hypothetical protein
MRYGRKRNDDPVAVHAKAHPISRTLQQYLQADYCEGVLQFGALRHDRDQHPDLFGVVDAHERLAIAGDAAARQDLAWLRLYRR